MAAATKNIHQYWREAGLVQEYQMAAQADAAQIYKGTLVSRDADGYARPATDTAGTKFLGVATEKVVPAVGDADGANKITLAVEGVFEFNAAGMTQADVGKRVNVSDDNTVTLTGTNTIKVGTIMEVVSATRVKVKIDPHAV